MSKHTPGPWRRQGYIIFGAQIARPVAKISTTAMEHLEDNANARLITSAPDLLEALKEVVGDCKCTLRQRLSGHLVECSVPNALFVIEKAEGKL